MILNISTFYFLIFDILMLSIERMDWINESTASFVQIIGLILFSLYTTLIYSENKKFILTSFYQIFYFSGMLLSALFLSFGVPMIEIGESGSSNGTFWVLMIFCIVGLYFSKKSFEFGFSSSFGLHAPKLAAGKEMLICLVLATIPLISSGIVFFQYGAPATSGERTIFWNQTVPPYLAWVNSSLKQMFFFVALIFTIPLLKSRFFPWLYLILYVFSTVFLLGEKASGLIILISVFLMVYSVGETRKIDFQVYFWGGIVAILIFYLIINSYRESDYGDVFVLTRIALQAQVLWSTLNVNSFPFTPSESLFNIPNILNASDHLTYKFLPNYLYENYTETGSTLSGFLPAFSIIYFGIFGALVAHSIASVLIGYISGLMVTTISSGAYIFSFLLFKIYLAIIFSWFALIFSATFGVAFFVNILLIFVMYLMTKLRTRQVSIV